VEAIEDEERIIRAASTAEAHGFLSKLPQGYDTVLSRLFAGGTDLSLGQWQRIALARAFFRDAPFLIMDEPTASLDPAAEHQIFSKVRSVLEGRTVLLISHRFSSVGLADRIYVLSEGAVVERGTHDELMKVDGQYAHLFRLQAAAYLKEPS
jgi:ATP-binding cassette subfamily B protein